MAQNIGLNERSLKYLCNKCKHTKGEYVFIHRFVYETQLDDDK